MTTVASRPAHPIERILPLFKNYKRQPGTGRYSVPCPAHNDTNPSAAIWEDGPDHVGMICYAGCSHQAMLEALGITWQDLYRERREVEPQTGLSLLDLSAKKLIHWRFLESLGVTEHTEKGRRSVHIPYYTSDGEPYERYRIRYDLTSTKGSAWNTGTTAPLIPYGLDRLQEARNAGYLVIVEGESDCWTLWQRELPALGIPGVTQVKTLAYSHIEGIRRIYVMREPPSERDKQNGKDPGKKFVEDCKKHLLNLGYQGRLYELDLFQSHGVKDPNELHKRDVPAFKATFEQALNQARPLFKEREKMETFLLRDLQQKELPEMKWAIDPILPEGLTILGGKPKLGKSWLALALLSAIACGGTALGQYPVEQGEVLYIALEDGERRLKNRSNTLLDHALASPNFYCSIKCPRIDEGGLEELEEWIDKHPRTRLICIDTWARFKPQSHNSRKSQYDEDYEAIAPLQQLAQRRQVSIIVVDHMRKMEAEDGIDMLSGSVGKSGAVDGFLLLYRKRQETDARLCVIGRDIEEEQELLLSFNRECASWVVKGEVDDTALASTPERQAILDLLCASEQGYTYKEVAKLLQKNENTTRNLLARLRREEKIILQNNRYSVVTVVKRSHHSQRGHRSHEPSEDVTTESVTTPITEHDYGMTTPMTTPVVMADQPVEPSRTDENEDMTTVTTVTTQISREDQKRIIWQYGQAHDFPRLRYAEHAHIPATELAWRGFLKWQDTLWPLAYDAIVTGTAMPVREPGV